MWEAYGGALRDPLQSAFWVTPAQAKLFPYIDAYLLAPPLQFYTVKFSKDPPLILCGFLCLENSEAG